MSASRARKIMLAAIAISLLLHLLLAGYIRWPFNPLPNETAIVNVRRITIARVPPHTPPPTPAPTPVPTPHVTPAVKASVVPPRVSAHASRGPSVTHAIVPAPAAATSAARPTAAPTAAPTVVAAQACAERDITPAVSATAQPVDIPPEVRASKTSGVAAIQVQIDPRGRVTGTTVSQSSGNAGLDEVAVQMARGATYTPALVKCKPVASDYTFTVRFAAW